MMFRDHLQRAVDELAKSSLYRHIDAEIGPPATDADVAELESALGFALDPRFVEYFRACNGAKISWVMWEGRAERDTLVNELRSNYAMQHDPTGDYVGSLWIPSLRELVRAEPPIFDSRTKPGEHREPILGGFDRHELEQALRPINPPYLLEPLDRWQAPTGLLLHPRFPDPVVLFASNNGAALSDARPMRARTYFDYLALTVGGVGASKCVRASRGAPGDHPIVEGPPGLWESQLFTGGGAYVAGVDAFLAKHGY